MKGVLAQSQIDALLQEISGGRLKLKTSADQKKVKEYDFRIPKKFTKEQLRTLIGVHETYARHLSSYLTGSLRTFSKVDVISIEETRYYEYANAMPESVLLGVLDLNPFDGTVVMSCSKELVFCIIDMLLGGSGTLCEMDRNYTDIEIALMERFYKNVISYMKDSWSSIVDIAPSFKRFETDNSANIMHLDEVVVIIVLDVAIKDISGKITVCLPFVWLDSISAKLYTRYRLAERHGDEADNELTQQALLSQIKQSYIDVSVSLGTSRVKVSDILNIEVGDVLMLNQGINDNVRVNVGSKTWFYGKAGIKNKKKAVKILSGVEQINS